MAKWLDSKGLEAHTGIAASTWNKKRVSGDGPPFAKVGGRCLYDIADVEEYLQSRKRRSTSEPATAA